VKGIAKCSKEKEPQRVEGGETDRSGGGYIEGGGPGRRNEKQGNKGLPKKESYCTVGKRSEITISKTPYRAKNQHRGGEQRPGERICSGNKMIGTG